MSFADTLARLRTAASERQRGMTAGSATVQQRDLLQLVEQFDRIDGLLRSAPTEREQVGKRAPSTIDECVAIIHRDLPGWWWTVGLCSLTGHASIGPDYIGPDRERLLAAFPVDLFDAGFHADLAPGGTLQAACDALMDCHRQALSAIAAVAPDKRACAESQK